MFNGRKVFLNLCTNLAKIKNYIKNVRVEGRGLQSMNLTAALTIHDFL
jgi:hypothetical protein